jgi:hypothetical protein
MRARIVIILVCAGAFCLVAQREARAWRGGGFGGFHSGGFGGFSSYHAGGFGGGYGSVHYSGASHYGPATGFTHYGGATYSGAGGTAHYGSATHVGYGGTEHYSGASYAGYGGAAHYGGYTERSVNYGSIQHYDANARVASPYGANVYHGPAGGTAATYRGPYASGAAVEGPAGYGAAVVKGPAGGTAAAYRGPYTSGAVAHLPSGYTAATWHGTTYYHSGYSFYQPTWYAGTVSYLPVYPPAGYFFPALPPAATPTVVGNNTYYVSDGVYYQPSTQNGQQGYAVVQAPAQAATPQPSAPAGGTGPDPFQLLKKMSDYMGGIPRIKMTVDETFDEVAVAGQKIQLSNQRTIQLKRPDKIAVDVNGTGIHRRIVFDGSTLTAVDLVKNLYSRVSLQGSLDSAMDALATTYGMAQPGEDLLYSDINSRLAPKIQAGQSLGRETVAGHTCNHLAFTQAGVSWQVWVDAGDKPVPWKLVITYGSTPGRPRYALLITSFETPALMPDSEFMVTLPDVVMWTNFMTLTGEQAGRQ